MKKCIAILISLLSILTMVSCSITDSDQERFIHTALSQIYEIGSYSYSNTEDVVFNHSNVISSDPIVTQELPSGKTTSIKTSVRNLNLEYDCSCFYPINNVKVHSYKISGNEECSVMLKEDGDIYAILGEFDTLDIKKTDSAETVRSALECAIADLVDLSKYEHMRVEASGASSSDFGIYDFVYYNTVHNYLADYLTVSVKSEGEIFALWKIDPDLSDAATLLSGLDKETENALLTAKLKSTLNTQHTEYRSHEIRFTPRVTVFEDELCVSYQIDCQIYYSADNMEWEEMITVLIPVRLLNGTGD